MIGCSIFNTLVLLPAGIRAQESLDNYTAYVFGAIHVMCELEGEGFISKVIARDLLQYVKNNDDIPKRTVNQAFQHVVNDTSPSSGPLPS